MASIMQMKDLMNKPSRNGFDLSSKVNFSAKFGELLPVWNMSIIPNDTVEIDMQALSRTMPVNTPAFARMRHYYDFFFVPYHILWNKFDSAITQMFNNVQHASGPLMDDNLPLSGTMPNFALHDFLTYLHDLAGQTAYKTNFFNYDRTLLSAKLMSYLGLGNYQQLAQYCTSDTIPAFPSKNPLLNIFKPMAYQAIYSYHYRFSQWERPNPSSFNLDYIKGTDDLTLSGFNTEDFYKDFNLFDLRYCNYQMDYFHGLLPNPQYGDEAIVPLSGGLSGDLFKSGSSIRPNGYYQVQGNGVFSANLSDYEFKKIIGNDYNMISKDSAKASAMPIAEVFGSQLNSMLEDVVKSRSTLSILALRQAEFLQKWKEIAQSGDEDYRSQIKKHWGVTADERAAHMPKFLGGVTVDVSINEVVNTNLTGDNAADLAGKGFGSGQGKIKFNSGADYGIVMCIFHALPVVDYITSGVDAEFLRVQAQDYAIAEFDKVGMQQIPYAQIRMFSPNKILPVDFAGFLGYAPRYIDYKTAYDKSLGVFTDTLQSWVLPYTDDDVATYINSAPSGVNPNDKTKYIYYNFFKVNPNIGDSIFAVEVDSSCNSDQFLISSYFKVNAVRSLDRDGLPY